MRRFFCDGPTGESTWVIEGEEHHHLTRVMRARRGDRIEIINGKGALFAAVVLDANSGGVRVRVRKIEEHPRPPVKLSLAPSLVKKRIMSDLVERLTELGADEIHPLIFQRTDAFHGETDIRRWEKIAIQALKVNRRLWPPLIQAPREASGILAEAPRFSHRLLLDHRGGEPEPDAWTPPTLAVIGPPGDLASEERDFFTGEGFAPTRINPHVLRTETATLGLCALLKSRREYG